MRCFNAGIEPCYLSGVNVIARGFSYCVASTSIYFAFPIIFGAFSCWGIIHGRQDEIELCRNLLSSWANVATTPSALSSWRSFIGYDGRWLRNMSLFLYSDPQVLSLRNVVFKRKPILFIVWFDEKIFMRALLNNFHISFNNKVYLRAVPNEKTNKRGTKN